MEAPRTFSIYWPGLEPLPMECYSIGSAELIVFTRNPRREFGRYPMQGEREAWRAADLLGREFDVMIVTRSSWSTRDHLSPEEMKRLNETLDRLAAPQLAR